MTQDQRNHTDHTAAVADDHDHGPREGAKIRVGILTCSDRSSRGERADTTGPTIHNIVVDRMNGHVAQYRVVPDNRQAIAAALTEWVDEHKLDLILTNGGSGMSPTDTTPEATRDVIEREVPSIVQAMVAESLRITPFAMLTRAVAGIRKQTLIVNLPGSPKAATENLDTVAEILPHAVDIIQGRDLHLPGKGGHGAAKQPKQEAHASHGAHDEHGHKEHAKTPAAAGAPTASGGMARNVGGPTC
ncbi:MAG: Molybdopterin adenylyltransferase [uncultured Chloroflexi bacterium]|uniref:Molybdopterin adenylyltransferase n=1 Tax=uncultured Chloroflexota bacterium TaxID=166587 RepID=A0A6J4JL20_9CHLR|nr:MAG: Molybdopterin adenylyltransferase [uncultured Chloroflexota bacterium]